MHKPVIETEQVVQEDDQHLHPRRPLLVLALVLASIGTGSGLALWVQRPSDAEYVGYLHVVSKPVIAGRNARISEVLVSEGQWIETGDPMFVLSDAQLDADRLKAENAVEQLDAELSQAQARAVVELQWRLDDLDQEIFESRLKSARYLQDKLSREVDQIAHKQLMKKFQDSNRQRTPVGLIRQIGQDEPSFVDEQARVATMLKVHESENAIEVASAQIDLCEARVAELKQLQAELPDKVRLSMGIHVAEARLAEAQDTLRRLEATQADLTVRATLPGTIGVVAGEAGDTVSATEPLVEILDPEQRYLIVNIPSTQVNKFEKGSELDLEFPNDVHRVGRVVKTSSQAQHAAGSRSRNNCVTEVAVHVEQAGKLWPTVPYRTTIKVRPQD
ncbi:HlyD family secretion protein [Symmachiella dynata]|uniref:HlyD family secretion protein n=1 Tax=Symmachiella dynata TaxID=2527995 RepID=UPI0030ED3FED